MNEEEIEEVLAADKRMAAGKRKRGKAAPGQTAKQSRLSRNGFGGEMLYEKLHTGICAGLLRSR